MRAACTEHGLEEPDLVGVRPRLTLPFWRMLVTCREDRYFKGRFFWTAEVRDRENLSPSDSPSLPEPFPAGKTRTAQAS